MEIALLNLFKSTPFIASFLAGILTFLSPCILPLLAPYFSYISGLSIQEITLKDHRSTLFTHSLAFGLGFSIVFILFGLGISFLFSFLPMNFLQIASGTLILIFGIYLLLPINLRSKFFKLFASSAPSFGQNINASRFGIKAALFPFMLGAGFALGWTPCVGPILAGIIALNASAGFSFKGFILLSCFALGLLLSFLVASLALGRFLRLFKRFNLSVVELISGLLLVALSIYIFIEGI